MRRSVVAVALVLAACFAGPPALAQDAPRIPTMFERYPAIATSCLPAEKIEWTREACDYLLEKIKARAQSLRLKTATMQPGLNYADTTLGAIEGVPGENAIRAPAVFKEIDGEPAGRVRFTFQSVVMVPGQNGARLAIPFLPGELVIEPTKSFADAKPFVDSLIELFFKSGERLVQ